MMTTHKPSIVRGNVIVLACIHFQHYIVNALITTATINPQVINNKQEGKMDQDGSLLPDESLNDGSAEAEGVNNIAETGAAQVEMINASESTVAAAAAAAGQVATARAVASVASLPVVAAAAAPVPSNVTVHPMSSASHQSMLRQLAHSPSSARAAMPNRNFAAPQEAARPAQQPQQQPIVQHMQALNINAAAPPNNNNPNNNNPPNNNPNNIPNNNNNIQDHLQLHNDPEHAMESEDVFHPCSPSGSASSGWSVVETSQGGAGGAPPSARSLHAAALLNGIMYVFGGYDGNVRVNTFHAFSFAEKRWSPVLPSSNSAGPPSPRDRHVAVAFGNSFYVHGGFDGTARTADLWAFDFSSMTWREIVPLHGRPPSPRHSHAAVVYGSSMFVFG